ncbi:Beta-casein [Frankliniella fusca]|uniref:Beta-casein n=1 Tax=Frankliniella fusca TaxID=407009 RepID=A0AAE1LRA5_9NEOP|nr:Beta-casein [Frankliniella fusca]
MQDFDGEFVMGTSSPLKMNGTMKSVNVTTMVCPRWAPLSGPSSDTHPQANAPVGETPVVVPVTHESNVSGPKQMAPIPKRSSARKHPLKPFEFDFDVPKARGPPCKIPSSEARVRPTVNVPRVPRENPKDIEAALVVEEFIGSLMAEGCTITGRATEVTATVAKVSSLKECYVRLERVDTPTQMSSKNTDDKGTEEVTLEKSPVKAKRVEQKKVSGRSQQKSAAKPTKGTNKKGHALKVSKAVAYGFGVANRTNVIQNVSILCPVCGSRNATWKHINKSHVDLDSEKIKAYAQGMYSSNCRGPYFKKDVIDYLYNAAQTSKDDFEKKLKNFCCNSGVGLTENPREAVPIYDVGVVFAKGYEIPKDHQLNLFLQADLELSETESSSEESDI